VLGQVEIYGWDKIDLRSAMSGGEGRVGQL
jgi:hypothetical protein